MTRCVGYSWLLLACGWPLVTAAQDVELVLHPDQVLNRIDDKVYGHFLEHIYHSVNGGLWGELVWNRTFEQNALGNWSSTDDGLAQDGLGVNQRRIFGAPDWTDYEYTLEARKTGGQEGFLILFRCLSDDDFYWCNLGGWGNVAHQLERGRSGRGRWHPVGPRVEGSIARDRWYSIRVRCEGARIQVWLDGRPLIDFTDPDGHAGGRVGIGTWATTAQFRNLEVRSLDGKTLFAGVPEVLRQDSVAQHWRKVGSGRVSIAAGDAANGKCSQRLVGQAGETGIEQQPLAIQADETYVGSLFARGAAPAGLTVRLRDGDRDLAVAALPAPDDSWREYPITLTARGAARAARLQIVTSGASDVRIDQVSLMPRSWQQGGGFRPDLLSAIAELRPPVIRWPGGCFASPYRWKDAIGPQAQRTIYPVEIWDDRDVNSFGVDEFVAMCRCVGAEPLLVVNIGTRTWNGDVDPAEFLQDVRDWIEYCNGDADTTWGRVRAANGHPEPYGVKYWEIDNETWHMGAAAYADAVNTFAPAMKQADPTLRLAACGSAGYGDDLNGLPWNRTIIQKCAEHIDYLSIHHYENPDAFAQGPRIYEAFFQKTADLIAQSANPNLKIYVSEWNAQSTDWRTGLYCGGLLNAFERCGRFLEVGGPALFLRHVTATDWDNAFVNFDQDRWFPAPNYVVMKLWRDHYADQRIAVTGDVAGLDVVATTSASPRQYTLKAVNPTDAARVVWVSVAGVDHLAMPRLEVIAPDSLSARNTLEEPDKIRPTTIDADRADARVRFTLPPYSVAVLSIPGGEK